MNKEIYKISKRSLGIRPLSMGVPLPGYAAPMRHHIHLLPKNKLADFKQPPIG